MKGYRRLRMWETIKEGDMFMASGTLLKSIMIGEKVSPKDIREYYRPITPKKKVKRRIDLRAIVAGLVNKHIGIELKRTGHTSHYWIGLKVANEVIPFIRNNYRRRQRSK